MIESNAICAGQAAGLFRNCATARLIVASVLSVCALSNAGLAADASKGDYAPGQTPDTTESTVPKTIYLTPKSDRLLPSKSDRFDAVPAPVAPEPELTDLPMAEPQEAETPVEDAAVPEITIPFDPHVVAPSQAGDAVPRSKPPIKVRGRPIDIALRKGRLFLNRFHTFAVQMPHGECRKFPEFITADYNLPRRAIDTLSDNMMIIQKRICAANGSVVVTCYLNEATISLRRARPDDGCQK